MGCCMIDPFMSKHMYIIYAVYYIFSLSLFFPPVALRLCLCLFEYSPLQKRTIFLVILKSQKKKPRKEIIWDVL